MWTFTLSSQIVCDNWISHSTPCCGGEQCRRQDAGWEEVPAECSCFRSFELENGTCTSCFFFFFFLELPPMTSLLKTLASLSHGALVSLWWKKIISHLKNSLRNVLSFSFEIRWEPSYCLQWLSTCVIEDEFLPYLTDSSCQQHCQYGA